MSGTYHRVYDRIWREPWTQDERYLAFYLLTCEHRAFEGIYRLPLAYASEDLGWPTRKVRSTLASLAGYGFAEYDHDAQVVWIVKALKLQTPNGNQAKAAARKVYALPPTRLLEPFREASETLCPTLAEALREVFAKGSATGASHSKLQAPSSLSLRSTGPSERGNREKEKAA